LLLCDEVKPENPDLSDQARYFVKYKPERLEAKNPLIY